MKLVIALSAAAAVVLSAVGLFGQDGQSDSGSLAGLRLAYPESSDPTAAVSDIPVLEDPSLQVRSQPLATAPDTASPPRQVATAVDDVMGRGVAKATATSDTPDVDEPDTEATEDATPDDANARTADPSATATPSPTAEPTAEPTTDPDCEAAYPDFCIASGHADLDCDEVAAEGFTVLSPDPYDLDSDGDGIGCEEEPPAPAPSPSGNGLLDAVNARRAGIGLPALRINGALQTAAISYCPIAGQYFADHGSLSHDAGSSLSQRIQAAGWSGGAWGETLAWTQAGPSAELFEHVADSWWNSSGHHALLYEPRFSQAGAAHCTVAGKTFYVIDLGA